jgi:hypothetical protein
MKSAENSKQSNDEGTNLAEKSAQTRDDMLVDAVERECAPRLVLHMKRVQINQ